MKYILSSFLMLLWASSLSAQVLTLPNDVDKFLEEYTGQTEKLLGKNIEESNQRFSDFYQNTLNTEGKTQLIDLMIFLSKKGVRPIDLVRFTEILNNYRLNLNPRPDIFISFFPDLKKAFDPYPGKRITDAINQLDDFFKKGLLYSSSFNSVKISPQDFTTSFFDKKQNYFSDIKEISNPVISDDFGWDDNLEEYDPWNDPAAMKKEAAEARLNLPQVQGLFFVFKNADLTLLSPSDSIVISGTGGAYNFMENLFIGSGGKIIWSAAESQVTAKLDKFSFTSTQGKLVAENVNLSHQDVIKENIEGALEIKLEKRPVNQPSTYPRFKSYHNEASYLLRNDNIQFIGGYTLVGQKITTTSLYGRYTKLRVNKGIENKEFEVIGRSLTVTDSLISSDIVSFVARLGADSVTHPGTKFKYDLKNQHVQLNKVEKGGFRNAMFTDTFHQVDIRCDAMSWDIDSGRMDFYIVAGKEVVAAEFESFDYYNAARMSHLGYAAGFNPIMAAANLVGRKKQNVITIEEMMQITRKEHYQVSNAMLIGNQMGFFDYHPLENFYSLSRKGLHYYFVATGKKDYDDLVFSSLNRTGSENKNASINFQSKALDIIGAQNFRLSDSLGIHLVPNNESMKVIGNKVFSFDGKIQVKNFTFYGDFVLDYEKFLVNLNRIDSITFTPLELYKAGKNLQLGGNFQFGKTGKLYLNSPDNKSGRRNLAEYPKLEIPDGLTVYFDEKGRSHKFSEAVVFKNTFLKLDSLNEKNPVIPGTFQTGGIFKPIKDALVMVADSSMGMSHTASGPYALYGGSTALKSDSEIILNKKGIFTSGEITHLAAKLQAKEIKLLEDRTEAIGDRGKITETTLSNAYFPNVVFEDYKMYWDPAKDSMSVSSNKGFALYNASTNLNGSLVIRNIGLFGRGEIKRADSELSSKDFKFEQTGFHAGLASILVKTDTEQSKAAFSGKNLNIDFNVINSKVAMSSPVQDFNQNETAFLEFPYSSYKTTIDNALWDIKERQITMEGEPENSIFTSTAQHQYGLNFHGSGAKYDISQQSLSISGVEEIHSVDAAIIPPKGDVFVNDDGKLQPFKRATIVADTLNRFHTLTNADVTINSKLSYSGIADYQYVNVSLDTFNIKLGRFEFAEVTADGQILSSKGSGKLSTIAKATVSESDGVELAKKMLYKGDLTMMAPFKNLYLNGQVLPDLKRYPMIGGSWINYQGSKSENISIDIDETLKDGGKPLYVGLHMKYRADFDGIYPSFLSMKGSSDDSDIFLAQGSFARDEENQRFYVKSKTENGNSAEFYDETGLMKLTGRFDLLGVPTKVFETVGTAEVDLDSMKYRFNAMMVFDFPLPIATTKKMGENIVKANLDAGNTLAALEPGNEEFMQKLANYIGNSAAEKYKSESAKGLIPLFKSSNKFLKTLVLSDLNLIWNPHANAYYNTGTLGISNVGDVDINATTNGYVEIVQSHTTGNELNIYMDLSKDFWYYMVFRNGQLGMVTSDEEVNRLINTPGKKDKEKGVNFIDITVAQRFKKRFVTTYMGVTEEDYEKSLNERLKPPAPDKKKEKKESDGF